MSSATLEAEKFKEFFDSDMTAIVGNDKVGKASSTRKSRWGAPLAVSASESGAAPVASVPPSPPSSAIVLSLVGRQYDVGTSLHSAIVACLGR